MLLACLRIFAGGEGANRRCDCDGYRPDTLGGGIGKASFLFGVVYTRARSETFTAKINDRLQAMRLIVTICMICAFPSIDVLTPIR